MDATVGPKKIGMIVLSFALKRGDEPNPCNWRLSENARRIYTNETLSDNYVDIVAQWECALALGVKKCPVDLIVKYDERNPDGYLRSEGVIRPALRRFRALGITDVIVVCQFLQGFKCRSLVRSQGFTVLPRKMTGIGFYWQSDQWWTRDPIRLFLYAAWQAATGLWCKYFGSEISAIG